MTESPAASAQAAPLLDISDLSVTFRSGGRGTEVVHGVSLQVAAGQRVGVIGESGSGKTVTALSVLRLHDRRRTRYGSGSAITFDGRDMFRLSSRELRTLRGGDVAMVFQDPATSLNPVFTVGAQLTAVLRVHQGLSKSDARKAAAAALDAVEIRESASVLASYPHQLSGGMRQRVLIAMAIACQPRLLIADEPTSALDVTVQATVLDLLNDLVAGSGMSLLLITHDMGVLAQLCTDVYVMYAGRVVEQGPLRDLYTGPRHPYTRALLLSTPKVTGPRPHRLAVGPSTSAAASAGLPATGCPFAPRCAYAEDRCRSELPALPDRPHAAACHRADFVAAQPWAVGGATAQEPLPDRT